MAYEKYVPEFTDKDGQIYGVMDAEAREAVANLNSALNQIENVIGSPEPLVWEHDGDGYYIATNVTTIDVSSPYTRSSSYRGRCAFIACSPGDVFTVTLSKTGNTYRPYVFCGSDGAILFASDNVAFDGVRIVAPENSAYVGFNSNSTGAVLIGETNIEKLNNEFDAISTKVSAIEMIASGNASASGVSSLKRTPIITDFEKIATDKRMTVGGLSAYSGYDVYCIPVGDAKIIQIFGTDSSDPWYGTLNAYYRLILEKTDGTKNDYSGGGNLPYARSVNDEYLVLVQNNIAKLYVNVKQGTEETVLVNTDDGYAFRRDRNAVRLSAENTIKSMVYNSSGILNGLSGTPFSSTFSLWKYIHAGDSVVTFVRPSGVSAVGYFIGDGTETREKIADYAIAYYVAPEDGYVNLFTNVDNVAEAVFIPHDNANYNFLSGKKITFLGDSITYRWQWEQIVLAFCGGTGYNCGIGSTPLSGSSENAFWQSVRLNAVKETNPDMVVILGGANDASMNPTIGTDSNLTDKDTSTFIGAYSYIIDNLLTWKPSLKIVILSTTYTKASNIAEFATASKRVAEYYHLTYVDIFNQSGFNAYTFGNTSETKIYSTDQVHPNADGYRIMASIVIAKLRECFMEVN